MPSFSVNADDFSFDTTIIDISKSKENENIFKSHHSNELRNTFVLFFLELFPVIRCNLLPLRFAKGFSLLPGLGMRSNLKAEEN